MKLNRKLLYIEYHIDNPDGMSYDTFLRYLERWYTLTQIIEWKHKGGKPRSMHMYTKYLKVRYMHK